jgi:hypothetical protein
MAKPDSGKLTEEDYIKRSGRDRRVIPRAEDMLYRIAIGLNVLAWILLVGALVMFHFARPELVIGLHDYLGIESRTEWSDTHVIGLNALLKSCLVLTLVSMVLNQRRSRRQADRTGINLFILVAVVVISLLTLQITVTL